MTNIIVKIKYIICLLFLLNFQGASLFSQIDIKIDPVAALIAKNIKGGLEVGLNDILALDIDGTYSNSLSLPYKNLKFTHAKSFGFRINTKFYPYTQYRAEGLYIGPYLKYRYSKSPLYRHNRWTMGFMTGYKNLLPNKFYVDIGAGFGIRAHSSVRNITGDYIDGLIGRNFFESIYDYVSTRVGKYDLPTRLTIGYRIDGNARPKKAKKKNGVALLP